MIAAIDPSLTNTAVVVGDDKGFDVKCFGSQKLGNTVAARMLRYDSLVDRIATSFDDQAKDIDQIVIEGYSYASKKNREILGEYDREILGEYGGILRRHLVDVAPVHEVAPTTLKKFATGKGNAEKVIVATELQRRYGVGLGSSDEWDAYGLFRMGLCAFEGVPPQTKFQREAVEKAFGVEKPKTSSGS